MMATGLVLISASVPLDWTPSKNNNFWIYRFGNHKHYFQLNVSYITWSLKKRDI